MGRVLRWCVLRWLIDLWKEKGDMGDFVLLYIDKCWVVCKGEADSGYPSFCPEMLKLWNILPMYRGLLRTAAFKFAINPCL